MLCLPELWIIVMSALRYKFFLKYSEELSDNMDHSPTRNTVQLMPVVSAMHTVLIPKGFSSPSVFDTQAETLGQLGNEMFYTFKTSSTQQYLSGMLPKKATGPEQKMRL